MKRNPKVEAIAQRILPIQEELHRHPELSGQEHETLKRVMRVLDEAEIPYEKITEKNALVAWVEGDHEGNTVAFRADMDALPITEESGVDYASENPGVMHACGHDVHTAILLGTALYFKENPYFAGKIKFLFQPDEEKNGGALAMVQAGAVDDVDYILALHVDPSLEVGTFGFGGGFFNAAVDDFTITLRGDGGHAAHPQKTQDLIYASSFIIQGIQGAMTRKRSPLEPALVTVASIHAGSKPNILPKELTMEGTLRSSSQEVREEAAEVLTQQVQALAKAFDIEAEVEIEEGYIALVNDIIITERVKKLARSVFGPDSVKISPPSMGAEDFGYFLENVEGTYISLGVGSPEGENHPLHSPKFKADQDAIYYGIYLQVLSALSLVEK
ncbi:MAG: M20 family metallopeptidase [Tissierellia bacterium]|nr:M20 family metallopeptidase [Tissierellia bacterium]